MSGQGYQWPGPAHPGTGASSSASSNLLTENDLQILQDEQIARLLQEDLDSGQSESSTSFGSFAAFDATQAFSSSDQLSNYGRLLQSTTCSKCGFHMTVDGQSLTSRMKALASSQEGPHPYMRCTKCRLYSCVGCGKYHRDLDSLLSGPGPQQHNNRGTNNMDPSTVAYCCDRGRLFLVFSLLCGPEFAQLESADQPTTPSMAGRFRTRLRSKSDQGPAISPQSSPGKSPKPPRGTGSQLSKGTGYGGGEHSLLPSKILGAPQYRPTKGLKLNIPDALLERYFRFLAMLLPHSHRMHRKGFDVDRQQIIAAMLPRSPLLQAALELLRDESMEDLAAKHQLYDALVDFITTIHGHPDTMVTLFNDHALYPPGQQLVHIAFGASHPVNSTTETTQSVNGALRKLASYCQYYLGKAAGHKQDFQEAESLRALHLAQRICSVAAAQEADRREIENASRHSRPSLGNDSAYPPTSNVVTRSRSIRNAEVNKEMISRAAVAWHQENRVREIDDDKFMESYYFAKQAKALASATLARGRVKKLITQLASLRQDLPFGIYVRHAASRVDAMKVLIVGPADTPYELGLFEFDVFCGADFPNKPPEVQFRTTGQGRVAFNPNLYNNGKVCLSLLGTWAGQPWIPNVSTLEQILVSIQAMIFTENPWYNEPGRERRLDDTQSQTYNRQIQQSTVRHAMTYWLESRLGQPAKGAKSKAPAPTKANRPPPAGSQPAPMEPAMKAPSVGPTYHGYPMMNNPTVGSTSHGYPMMNTPTMGSNSHGYSTHAPQIPPGGGNPSAAPSQFGPHTGPPPPGLTPSKMFNLGPGNQAMVQPTSAQNTFPPGFAQGPGPVYHVGAGSQGPGQSNALPPQLPQHSGYIPNVVNLVGNPLGLQLSYAQAPSLPTPGNTYSGVPGNPGLVQYTPVPAPASGLPPMSSHPSQFNPMPPLGPFGHGSGSLGQTSAQNSMPAMPPMPPMHPMLTIPPLAPVPMPAAGQVGPPKANPHAANPLMPGPHPWSMFMEMTATEALLMTTHGHPMPMPLLFTGSDTKPIGNTVVDSNDDNVWGDVIRKHFSLKGGMMLALAKKWNINWQGNGERELPITKEFEAALELHSFI